MYITKNIKKPELLAPAGSLNKLKYAIMYGVNDTIKDACKLADLLEGMLCHVNLIPINAVEGARYRRAPQNVMMGFRDALNNRGITATVRRELGSDVDAACGQLRRQYFE